MSLAWADKTAFRERAQAEGWWRVYVGIRKYLMDTCQIGSVKAAELTFRAIGLDDGGGGVPDWDRAPERLRHEMGDAAPAEFPPVLFDFGSMSWAKRLERTKVDLGAPVVAGSGVDWRARLGEKSSRPVEHEKAPAKPQVLIGGRVSEVDVIRWVAENLDDEGLTAAPNRTAASLRAAVASTAQARRDFFFTLWPKILPTKGELDVELKRRDDGRDLSELEDAIFAAGGGSEPVGPEGTAGEPGIPPPDPGPGGQEPVAG